MKIIIEAKRWPSVRKALVWTNAKMWAHFGKSMTINIRCKQGRKP